MLMDKVVIFEAPGADPARDRILRESSAGRLTIVAIGYVEQAEAVVRDLVDAGAKLVELCGGFSPTWRTRISDAVGGRAQVSSVAYGIESLEAGARYKQAFERGETTTQAFILLEPGADPAADRFVMAREQLPTPIIPVPDEATAARIAGELADDGIQLIELYGGLSTRGIGMVLDAVAGRAAVGAGSFAHDAVVGLR